MRLFATKYSDKEILEAIRQGRDEFALGFLYKEVLPKVKKYILQNQGSEEEAKDIFQEAVIRFYNAVVQDKFLEKCTISTFMIGISKNLWINALKKKNRYVLSEESIVFAQDSVNLLEDIISDEKVEAVNKLLADLGEACEKILKYSIYENLSMKEISERMGYASEDVVKTKNYRCKQKLIQMIENQPALLKLFDR